LPRYDYLCPDCGNEFEVRQSFDSEPVATCGNCQGTARRVIHSVPVVFKGSGFYVNDYGKGKGSTSSSADSKASKDSDSGSDGKGSAKSKTETKVESKAGSSKDESS
jgi:putative FmdB family regulatory protein